jgi:hypothetical protein
MKQRTSYYVFYFICFLSLFFSTRQKFFSPFLSFLLVHLLMIDDKQSSIVRPKAVPPMFTPVLTPNTNTQSTTMNNTNRMPSQALVEMGMMIRKHDPEATRLYDCIGGVKVFAYNSTELRWENSPNIDGNLCAYERQQIINNKICPAYAFAIINGDKSHIQPVTADMAQHADKLRLFYEVARNGRREVFCLHFLTDAECLRLHTFLNRCIQALRTLAEQQARTPQPVPAPVEPPTQLNGQTASSMTLQQTPTNVYRQPMIVRREIFDTDLSNKISFVDVESNNTTIRISD